jgi:hypothetical protein
LEHTKAVAAAKQSACPPKAGSKKAAAGLKTSQPTSENWPRYDNENLTIGPNFANTFGSSSFTRFFPPPISFCRLFLEK